MRLGPQIGVLARRSLRTTFRQPFVVASSILFPLLFLAVTTAGAARAADVPGFPARSYLDFYVAGALVQGALFQGVATGTQLATDIEFGFIRRLLLTPMRRVALVVSLAAGAFAVGLIQGVVILGVGVAAGVEVQAGLMGALVVVGLVPVVAMAFSSIGTLIAARTGSSEATQGFFPLFFILMIFSSFFMPRELIGVGWFKAIADYNPATYIIEALRSPIITGWDGRALGIGLMTVVMIAVFGFGTAATSLRKRLVTS